MKVIALLLFVAALSGGCRKLLENGTPPNQLTTDKVFADSASAEAALVSAYAYLNVNVDPALNRYLGLYTDELNYTLSDQSVSDFYLGKVAVANTADLTAWRSLYQVVYRANDVIGQLAVSDLPVPTRAQFTLEARFLRAYAYFQLVNIWGNVPLLLTTEVNANRSAAQALPEAVYAQIVSDLVAARDGLGAAYHGAGRVRANKWAAAALLARVYLFRGDWANAEAQATAVLGSGLYTPLPAAANVFLAGSTETILSVYTVNGFITDAPVLIPTTLTGALTFPVSNALTGAFEAGDQRKVNWLRSYVSGSATYTYPYKYHNRAANTSAAENLVLLRAAELYLVRAEARAVEQYGRGGTGPERGAAARGAGGFTGDVERSGLAGRGEPGAARGTVPGKRQPLFLPEGERAVVR